MSEYPIKHGMYRGYSITEVSSFLSNKIIAKKAGDIHTRKYGIPDRQEETLEQLKSDIDQYGNYE